jgi:putative spermidine/putrescine transport system ATP-binding protein
MGASGTRGLIKIIDVTKVYPGAAAPSVCGLSFEVAQGDFLVLIGPSGCGKTTTLNMINRLVEPSSGRIEITGLAASDPVTLRRHIGYVFQEAGLFPHMTVAENIAITPRLLGWPKAETAARVTELLALVRLQEAGLAARRPQALSGGQRQRVALARALVNQPKVLLLDEPLGALDLKLREQMQVELKEIQRQVGITFLFVTHDQEEALTMSDRIAVFAGGRIEQVGSPAEVYEQPATPFVAGFVGTSNLLTGDAASQVLGKDGTWSVRPEKIRIADADGGGPAPDEDGALGTVREVVYVGSATRFLVDLDAGATLMAVRQNLQTSSMDVQGMRDSRVQLIWKKEHEFEVRSAPEPAAHT